MRSSPINVRLILTEFLFNENLKINCKFSLQKCNSFKYNNIPIDDYLRGAAHNFQLKFLKIKLC